MTSRSPNSRGERVIAFIERYVKVPEGKLVGQPMRLLPFQKRFILDVYDNPHGTRRGYLSIARKNGKTGLIAGILLAHLCGPEAKQNAQLSSGAMSRDQAAIVFNLAAKMVRLSPELASRVHIIPSKKRLIGTSAGTEYTALSAEGKTAHGASPVLVILDEIGQVRGPQSDFVDAMITSQGAHEEPLLLAISTQAPNDNDLFSIWLDDAKTSKDPRIISHVYESDKDCDVLDEEEWKKSNPAVGVFRSYEDLKEQAERASRMPSFANTFRNLGLNQRVEMIAPFISSGVWKKSIRPIDLEAFAEGPVFGGLDLSARTDLTSLVLVAPKDGRWHVTSFFWTPAEGLKERAKRDRAPYDVWHRQGYLRTTPGSSVSYKDVAQDITDILSDLGDLEAIAFDRWRMDILKKELENMAIELPLTPFGQGFKDMSPALEKLEELLLNDQVCIEDNPVLTMCAANARAETDPAGNRKLVKGRATGRIDGMVALAMAVGSTNVNVEKSRERTYQMLFV